MKRIRSPKDLSVSVGERLRVLRKTQKLTQSGLAEKARVSWKYIGEVERGRRDLRLNTLGRIARALGVEPAELLRFTDADQTVSVIEGMLRGRDDAFRGHLVRVVREILLLTDSAA